MTRWGLGHTLLPHGGHNFEPLNTVCCVEPYKQHHSTVREDIVTVFRAAEYNLRGFIALARQSCQRVAQFVQQSWSFSQCKRLQHSQSDSCHAALPVQLGCTQQMILY